MFLRFANFYKRFIKGYLKIAALLINLIKIKASSSKLKKLHINILFLLLPDKVKEKVFKSLKNAFTKVPILAYFNPNQEI